MSGVPLWELGLGGSGSLIGLIDFGLFQLKNFKHGFSRENWKKKLNQILLVKGSNTVWLLFGLLLGVRKSKT